MAEAPRIDPPRHELGQEEMHDQDVSRVDLFPGVGQGDLPRSPQPDGSRHTPGPWHYYKADGILRNRIVAGEPEDGLNGETLVALPTQCEADAHLITAAPELLAACRELDDFVRLEEADGDDALWTDEYRALIENVRAAIAKAERRS